MSDSTKAVLISIRPEWCRKIVSGEKTLEVRKNMPKIDTPFKVYIYCTSGTGKNTLNIPISTDQLVEHLAETNSMACLNCPIGNQKVIGEFTCDKIIPISVKYSDPSSHLSLREFPFTCLTDRQIIQYLGNGVDGYGWNISDLRIYDHPKELKEFRKWSEETPCVSGKYCEHEYFDYSEGTMACRIDFDGADCVKLVLSRPPQSWCYVEVIP